MMRPSRLNDSLTDIFQDGGSKPTGRESSSAVKNANSQWRSFKNVDEDWVAPTPTGGGRKTLSGSANPYVSANAAIQSRRSLKQRAFSIYDHEGAFSRGSNYFGMAENRLLFGSTAAPADLQRRSSSESFDEERSRDSWELEGRDSFLRLSESASQISGETDSFTDVNDALVPNRTFPRHHLKASPSDLIFLKKRLYFPGIWEEDLEEELSSIKADVISERRASKSQLVQQPSQQIGSAANMRPSISRPHARAKEEKYLKKKDRDEKQRAHEEGLKLLERICILKEESKRPKTLKERYLGHRPIPGLPGCLDKTEGHPHCMKPGELVRLAVSAKRLWNIPENRALSREQFIQLIRQIEQFERNDYICLVYSLPEDHPEFNPYRFKIVPYTQVPPKTGFYTLSKNGFLFIAQDEAEFTSMVQFQAQMLIYEHIRRIPFFGQFRIWKAFTLWRVKLRNRKRAFLKSTLLRDLFINTGPLLLVLKELKKMREKMSQLTFLKLKYNVTFGLDEFMGLETHQVGDVREKLKAFEDIVMEMVKTACRAILDGEGFKQDWYAEEMKFFQEYMQAPISEIGKPLNKGKYPGDWLTYSEQTRKRHICRRLTNFIRLVDYHMQHTYYQIMKNSLTYLMLEMHRRARLAPEGYEISSEAYEDAMEDLVREHEKHSVRIALSASVEPIFEVDCGWAPEGVVLSPNVSDFVKGLRYLCHSWKKTILGYKNMVTREIFNPYTQPISNGFVDKKTCGDGPDMKLLVENDSHILELADVVQTIFQEGFQSCVTYAKELEHIHQFCLENEQLEAELTTAGVANVGEYLELDARFSEQFEVVEKIQDKKLGLFKVDSSGVKEHAHLLLIRCMEELRRFTPTPEEILAWEKSLLPPEEIEEEEEEEEDEEELCSEGEEGDCEEELCSEEEDCEEEEGGGGGGDDEEEEEGAKISWTDEEEEESIGEG